MPMPGPGTLACNEAKEIFRQELKPYLQNYEYIVNSFNPEDIEFDEVVRTSSDLLANTALLFNSTDNVIKDIPWLGDWIAPALGEVPIVNIIVRPAESYRNKIRIKNLSASLDRSNAAIENLKNTSSFHDLRLKPLERNNEKLTKVMPNIINKLENQEYLNEYFYADIKALWKHIYALWFLTIGILVSIVAIATMTVKHNRQQIEHAQAIERLLNEHSNSFTYTIKKNDTLRAIAYSQCGSPNLASRIYATNRAILKSPDEIIAGTTIVIDCP